MLNEEQKLHLLFLWTDELWGRNQRIFSCNSNVCFCHLFTYRAHSICACKTTLCCSASRGTINNSVCYWIPTKRSFTSLFFSRGLFSGRMGGGLGNRVTFPFKLCRLDCRPSKQWLWWSVVTSSITMDIYSAKQAWKIVWIPGWLTENYFNIKPKIKVILYIPPLGKSTFKPQSFKTDSVFLLEKFAYLRLSHCSDFWITQRTAKCIYLFGGVIEVIWEQWNCLVRKSWSLSGSARRLKRKWRVRKRKGLNAVSSLIYCSLSPPLPLSPTLLLLFHFSILYFKRKH